jgi:hypothetical protein
MCVTHNSPVVARRHEVPVTPNLRVQPRGGPRAQLGCGTPFDYMLAFRRMGPDLLLLDRHFVDAHMPVAALQSSTKHYHSRPTQSPLSHAS